MHDILHEAVHYFTHADKGFIGLLRDLALKNGKVAREYVAGMRKKYFPPLTFFLLVGTIYVIIMSFVTSHHPYNVYEDHPELSQMPKDAQLYVAAIYERQHSAVRFMGKYSNSISMAAIPLICCVYWLFYLRQRYNYTEHLVACMYMSGFTHLLYILIVVPVGVAFGVKEGHTIGLALVHMVIETVYNSAFYYHFMNRKIRLSMLYAFAASLQQSLSGMGAFGFRGRSLYTQ
jgi:cellobiose-specific phosphotransferase system component IIC